MSAVPSLSVVVHVETETPIAVEEVRGVSEPFPTVRVGSQMQSVTIITDLAGLCRLRDAVDSYLREHDPVIAQQPDPVGMPASSDEAMLLVPDVPSDEVPF